MTPVSYVYKITFLEVPHWYWGWHTERKAGEHYMGSPSTHKEYWERYPPVKEIVRVFENTPEGKLQAQLLEKELIKPDLNNPFCLNESCSGVISTRINVETASGVMKKRWADLEQRQIMTERARNKCKDPLKREEAARKMSELSKVFGKIRNTEGGDLSGGGESSQISGMILNGRRDS